MGLLLDSELTPRARAESRTLRLKDYNNRVDADDAERPQTSAVNKHVLFFDCARLHWFCVICVRG